jgi:hypothetical protein
MKLLMIWLFGVPGMVAFMVLAYALPSASHRVVQSGSQASARCLAQGELHQVAPGVADQGHRVACNS